MYIGYFLLPNKILNYSYFIYTTPSKPILNYLMNGFKYIIFFKIKQIYKGEIRTFETGVKEYYNYLTKKINTDKK